MSLHLKSFEVCPYGDICPYSNKYGKCFGLDNKRDNEFRCKLIYFDKNKNIKFVDKRRRFYV